MPHAEMNDRTQMDEPGLQRPHRHRHGHRHRYRYRHTGPRHRLAVVMLVVCVALAGLLSSCGQEGVSGAAPLSERAENDVPLNPPTLRFHVSKDGRVEASPDREAEAGEVVAIVLENESDARYELHLMDPDGEDVFTVDAPAGERGDGRTMPRVVGSHVVKIYPADTPQAAEEFLVDVSKT